MLNHLLQVSSNQNFTANLTALQRNPATVFLSSRVGEAEGGDLNITFHFRKTKIEITSPYTSPRVLCEGSRCHGAAAIHQRHQGAPPLTLAAAR